MNLSSVSIDLLVTGKSCRHVYVFTVLKVEDFNVTLLNKFATKSIGNILYSRSYVYSVARDCDNGKVDPKVPPLNTITIIFSCLQQRKHCKTSSLVVTNFRTVLELYSVQLKEQRRLLCRRYNV